MVEIIKRRCINEGEEIDTIIIKKGNALRETFGTHKFSKSVKKMMKEMDKELYDI